MKNDNTETVISKEACEDSKKYESGYNPFCKTHHNEKCITISEVREKNFGREIFMT